MDDSRSRDRVFEATRILVRRSRTQFRRGDCSFSDEDLKTEGWIILRRRLRARMGARERKDKKASLMMMRGEMRMEEIDSGVELEEVDTTVWRMSPICIRS